MRLWYFSSSVNSFFKRACAVGLVVWFFGQTLRLLPYFMCANSEGSGEIVRMCRLAWAFAGRLCDKYHNCMSWLIVPTIFLIDSVLVQDKSFPLSHLSGHLPIDVPHGCKIIQYVYNWDMSWENLFIPYVNNKDADQPAHLRSLISIFVVRCLDSIISLVSLCAIFWL